MTAVDPDDAALAHVVPQLRAAIDRCALDLSDLVVFTEAASGAELVLHLTDWPDYQALDPGALAAVVARPVLIDARCSLDAALWHAAGWSVRVPGRPGLG